MFERKYKEPSTLGEGVTEKEDFKLNIKVDESDVVEHGELKTKEKQKNKGVWGSSVASK